MTQDQQIEQFAARVQPIYAALNWQWHSPDVDGVPSVQDIVNTTHHLIDMVKQSSDRYANHSTGGLFARYQGSGIDFGMEIGDFLDMGYSLVE